MLTATRANEVRARNLCKPHFLLSPSPQSHKMGLSIYWNNSRPVEVTRATVSKLSTQKKVHYYPDLQNIMNRKVTRMTAVILNIKIFEGIIITDCPAVSLDLYIYTTNKYPNVKQLSWAINWPSRYHPPDPPHPITLVRDFAHVFFVF